MKCRNLSELLAGCLALVIALSTLSVRAEGSGPAPAAAFAQLEARLLAANPEDPAAFSFAITVAGTPAATARLQLDTAGLPRLRRQTVVFPGGEMRVTERYSAFAIEE